MENYKTVAFAYFSENEFLGWYGGTFGSVAKTPKLYGNSERQLATIEKNFQHKLKTVNTSSFDVEKDKVTGVAAISLLSYDGEEVLRNRNVELRIVESPEYSGPNPEFDQLFHEKLREERRIVFNKESTHLSDEPSKERSEFVKEFDKRHPEFEEKVRNWSYPDYEKVREWAKITPTEFLDVLSTYIFFY